MREEGFGGLRVIHCSVADGTCGHADDHATGMHVVAGACAVADFAGFVDDLIECLLSVRWKGQPVFKMHKERWISQYLTGKT